MPYLGLLQFNLRCPLTKREFKSKIKDSETARKTVNKSHRKLKTQTDGYYETCEGIRNTAVDRWWG